MGYVESAVTRDCVKADTMTDEILMRDEPSLWQNELRTVMTEQGDYARAMGRSGQHHHIVTTQYEEDWEDQCIGFYPKGFEYEPNPVIFSHLCRSSFPTPTHINSRRQEETKT
jgi:hypothetical protein